MNETYELELKPHHKAYLDEIARKHELVDASKAIRCLVTFARQRPDLEDDIFETIRCTEC